MKRKSGILAAILVLALLAVPAFAENTLTITGEILPAGQPHADFSAQPTKGNAPLMVRFNDLSTGKITRYAWDFQNDGSIDSTRKNPTCIYTNPGTYSVKLTVSGPDGSDEEVKTGFITVTAPMRKPIALFTQDRVIGKNPLTVTFTDRSFFNPTDYLWTFGDGETSTLMSPVHTYTRPGLYMVTLKVSNAAGSDTARSTIIVLSNWWW